MSASSSPDDDYTHLNPAARLAFLKRGYDALVQREQRNDSRIKRGEKQRATIFIVMLLTIIVAVGALAVAYYQVQSSGDKTVVRNEQHTDTQQQIQMLACAWADSAPPGPTTDRFRRTYHCPTSSQKP